MSRNYSCILNGDDRSSHDIIASVYNNTMINAIHKHIVYLYRVIFLNMLLALCLSVFLNFFFFTNCLNINLFFNFCVRITTRVLNLWFIDRFKLNQHLKINHINNSQNKNEDIVLKIKITTYYSITFVKFHKLIIVAKYILWKYIQIFKFRI